MSIDTTTNQAPGLPPTISQAAQVSPDEYLPPVLDRQQVEKYIEHFTEEYQPIGPTESAIVRDMARQAAAMERWGCAAEAVERHAAQMLPTLEELASHHPDREDALLAAAMGTDSADRCERHALGHSRAFYRALQKLEELQTRRKKRKSLGPAEPPAGFTSEAECENYLADRFRQGKCRCQKCGGTKGYFFPARKCWECRQCKTQTGLRAGTVMFRSPIPLQSWFETIRWIRWEPTISTKRLVQKIAITRPATVAKMAGKIRSALCTENATMLLAGLDQLKTPSTNSS